MRRSRNSSATWRKPELACQGKEVGTEKSPTLRRTLRLRALFFLRTTTKTFSEKLRDFASRIGKFDQQRVGAGEFLQETPQLAKNWVAGNANDKQSQVLLNVELAEEKRISNEILRQTVQEKIRQERATTVRLFAEAFKAQTDARVAQVEELRGRIKLFEECRQMGVIFKHDGDAFSIEKASRDFNWENAALNLFTQEELEILRTEAVSPETDPNPKPPGILASD